MRSAFARIAYVLRHLALVWFLVALLGANLDGGPVEAALRPWFGKWIELVGLRQHWSMFAPNPTHYGSFASAFHVTEAGEVELPGSFEPPLEGPYFRIGYDRILKLTKKVTVAESSKAADLRRRETHVRAYAQSLCMIHGLEGEVRLEKYLYYVPSPSRRAKGWLRVRLPEPLGTYPCP